MITRLLKLADSSGARELLVILGMGLAVVGVYWSVPSDPDSTLIGLDFGQLHVRRMQFARAALLSSAHTLPAWYPRELLGTPFWSNIQNFPFIPTRLIVLTMDPSSPYAYFVAVAMSAVLSALFTYLYLRKIGLAMIPSAAAGWTFAWSGFYAARIAAGHLPLLEAYPALPLLMWVSESLLQVKERGESMRAWVGALTLSSACVMLAGHPQLSVYAVAMVSLYLVVRSGVRGALRVSACMLLGFGIAAFALIPMGMLIGRSTRVLPLAVPANDVAMPYGRLSAFFFPWQDGAPRPLGRAAVSPFVGYPNWAYFWETVSYVGLLPWIGLALLLWFVARGKINQRQDKIAKFILTMGIVGIILSLPIVHAAMSVIPATIFRSPARLLYLTEFALAVALGWAVHLTYLQVHGRLGRFAVSCLLAMHVWDLSGHSREFILRVPNLRQLDSEVFTEVLTTLADGRVAMDYRLTMPINRTIDDIGFFDSIMLARTYRMLLSVGNLSADLNIQAFDGSEISSRALAAAAVKKVITTNERQDLQKEKQAGKVSVYNIPAPSQRAEFFEIDRIRYLPRDQIHTTLRNPDFDPRSILLLPREAAVPKAETNRANIPAKIEYRRPTSDHIEVSVATGTSGYLRIIESWDPGWTVTVNGSPATIVPAMDALLAVAVPSGRHEVRFDYRTPGALVGRIVSIISLALLGCMIWMSGRRRDIDGEIRIL